MKNLLLLAVSFGCFACASAPKKKPVETVKVDPRQAELEPFLASLEADEDAAEEEGRSPRRRLLAGRMLLARKGIDDVLLAANEKGEPDLLRALLLARKGNFQDALSAARASDSDEGVKLSVAILLAAGEVETAKQVLNSSDRKAVSTVLSAWLMHREEKSGEAIKALRKHLFNQGRDLFAYVTLARIHAEQGELRLARLVCKEGLKQAPKDSDLHYLLGTIERTRGRKVAAARSFDAALRADPGHLGALLERTRLDLVGFDYASALRHSERAFLMAPGDPEAALIHALSLRANGRCDDSKALLESWVERKPLALFNLGVLHLRCRDDAKTAAPLFKQFIEKESPQRGHPVHNLLVEAEALAE